MVSSCVYIVPVSSPRTTRGTRAYPSSACAKTERPAPMLVLAERWAGFKAHMICPRTTPHGVLTSFGVTVVLLLFITVVIPVIITLVRNF